MTFDDIPLESTVCGANGQGQIWYMLDDILYVGGSGWIRSFKELGYTEMVNESWNSYKTVVGQKKYKTVNIFFVFAFCNYNDFLRG